MGRPVHDRVTAAAAALFLSCLVLAGPARPCVPCADFDFLCCDIPADNRYYLTSFSGEGMACGGYADGTWYYATSWVRWYCDAKLALTNPDTGDCVVVQVADAGPAAWVEETAGMPIIDASPLVCSDLFGSGSCGWSDRFVVEAVQVPDDTPEGPGGCSTVEPCETVIAPSGETIIDDAGPCFTRGCLSHSNSWWPVGAGYDGDAIFTYAIDAAEHDCWGRWELTFLEAGSYALSAHVPDTTDRSAGAVYRVRHGGIDGEVSLDQSAVSGWADLGDFDFSAGGDQEVMLTDRTGEALSESRKVVFDALRLAPSSSTVPEETPEETADAFEEPVVSETVEDGVEAGEPDADDADVLPDGTMDGGEIYLEGGCSCSHAS